MPNTQGKEVKVNEHLTVKDGQMKYKSNPWTPIALVALFPMSKTEVYLLLFDENQDGVDVEIPRKRVGEIIEEALPK